MTITQRAEERCFTVVFPQKKGPPKSRSEAETYWGDPALHEEKGSYASSDKGNSEESEAFTKQRLYDVLQ